MVKYPQLNNKNMKGYKPVVLVVLDGWGEWDEEKGNPLKTAKLPTIELLNQYYPRTLLQASGLSVGLPWGVRGNSEVGHQTLGVGQIIFQYLPLIDMAIQNKSFDKNETILKAIKHSKKNKKKIHLLGLLSDGSVHSHINHLIALLAIIKKEKVKEKVCVHCFLDGRDAPPKSAEKYIKQLQDAMDDIEIGEIASISGRYYAMDRNNNWDRTEKAYEALTKGTRIKEIDALSVLQGQYNRGITDEYFEPVTMVNEHGDPIGLIEDEDVLICYNFRKDRSRQLMQAFCDDCLEDFKTQKYENLNINIFTEYEKDMQANIVFPPQRITTRVGEIISEKGLKQLRIAETEKFAHVTYFFNGGNEKPFAGEDRQIIPSKDVPSYEKLPEMSAKEITDKLLKNIDGDKYDFILVNYANPDMVGHTGALEAGKKAVEFVDQCLDKLIKRVLSKNGSLLITADHGNVEEMINLTTFSKDTEHSTNPVPCWIVSPENKKKEPCEAPCVNIDGMLVDVAPTILDMLELNKPKEMIGRSLLDIVN